jgi:putative membrane protein
MERVKFDPQTFLEMLMCSVFAGLLVYLVASGEYLKYLTPRMKPYLYFAAAVMLAWAVSGVFRLFRARRKSRCAHCAVLLIPVLLMLLPHKAIGASDVSFGYITGGGQSASAAAPDTQQDSAGVTPDAPPDAAALEAMPARLDGLDAANRTIAIGDTNYYLWICEIYDNLDAYVGYTVSVTGYVLKDPEITGENEFVPARLMMACCAADLVACGLLCQYDGADALNSDDWVTVEGVIVKGEYMGYDEARLTVTSVTPADPIEGFVYMY